MRPVHVFIRPNLYRNHILPCTCPRARSRSHAVMYGAFLQNVPCDRTCPHRVFNSMTRREAPCFAYSPRFRETLYGILAVLGPIGRLHRRSEHATSEYGLRRPCSRKGLTNEINYQIRIGEASRIRTRLLAPTKWGFVHSLRAVWDRERSAAAVDFETDWTWSNGRRAA